MMITDCPFPVAPRRPLDDDVNSAYHDYEESDRDWFDNNAKAITWFLEESLDNGGGGPITEKEDTTGQYIEGDKLFRLACRVYERTKDKTHWEPRDGQSVEILALIAGGYIKRCTIVSGFNRFPDGGVCWTDAGRLAVKATS